MSPFDTVYLEPEGFFAVDFDVVDFFFAELLEAVVFLGVDEELAGVVFFDELKAYGSAGGSGSAGMGGF